MKTIEIYFNLEAETSFLIAPSKLNSFTVESTRSEK